MDLENQKRVKDFAEQYGPENVVVILGAAEGEAAGLAAETVTAGDPTLSENLRAAIAAQDEALADANIAAAVPAQ